MQLTLAAPSEVGGTAVAQQPDVPSVPAQRESPAADTRVGAGTSGEQALPGALRGLTTTAQGRFKALPRIQQLQDGSTLPKRATVDAGSQTGAGAPRSHAERRVTLPEGRP